MKTVTAHAEIRVPRVRCAVEEGGGFDALVKRGIKYRNLRQAWEQLLAQFDALNVGGVMQWR